jgi:serine/threonine protein kinase
MSNYKLKYLKYKKKYLELKLLYGGAKLKRQSSLIISNSNENILCQNRSDRVKLKNTLLPVTFICIEAKNGDINKLNEDLYNKKGKIIIEKKNYLLDNLQIKKDDVNYQKDKQIGHGSYGSVIRYKGKHKEKDVYLMIKIYNDYKDFLNEKLISIFLANFQKNEKKTFNIIPSYWFPNKFTLMHSRDGSLTDGINKLSNLDISQKISIINNIYNQIIISIYNLYKKGIYYTDLKSENLLFRYNNDIQITLGDLGCFYSYNNEFTNLFASNDLLGQEIIIVNELVNNYRLYITKNNELYLVGYFFYQNLNLSDGKYKIEKILADKVILKNLNINHDNEINHINLNLPSFVFTFPHIKNIDGYIDIRNNYQLNEIEIKKVLVNNLIYSIGALMFQFYLFIYHSEEIKYNNNLSFDKSYEERMRTVNQFLVGENKNKYNLIYEIISQQDYEYITQEQIEEIFEKLKNFKFQ